jgi:hypothetical protein
MRRSRSLRALLVVVAAGLSVLLVAPGSDATDARAAVGEEALPPLAWTTEASNVGPNGALLHGEFNPRGHRTVIRFEFGRTKDYGRVAPTYVEEEWFGEDANEEEEIAECLRPRTIYHLRIVAKSRYGTAYGADQTFKTRPGQAPRRHGCS